MIKIVSPRELYPTESLYSIEESRILFYMECFKENIETEKIKAFLFKDNYYILKGHHKMLAANRLGLQEISVEIAEKTEHSFWNDEKNVIDNLKAIGLSTLYDFEAVGGFTYDKYPDCYRRCE